MSDAVRRARLRGARDAERVLSMLEVRQRLVATHERVDVFGALAWLDVSVIFRPLDGLLGAYIQGDVPGVVISTKRPASVQRFTGAHELGHAMLGHEPSLDSPDVMRSASLDQPRRKITGFASYLQEIEADAFAGAFLLPVWLITRHAHRQGWSRADLANEDVVYQLALRCGSSYQATVWALHRNKFLTEADRLKLLGVRPKAIKARLGHEKPFADARRDAWKLTSRDVGVEIPVSIGDTVTIELRSADLDGRWRPSALPDTLVSAPPVIGEHECHHLKQSHRVTSSGISRLGFNMDRGESTPKAAVSFDLVATTPEKGLSRANRQRMISEARDRKVADLA